MKAPLLIVAVVVALLAVRDTEATHSCFPADPDAEGDGLANSCDPNSLTPDADYDGYHDSLEIFVSTNPLMQCVFPPDINGDNRVSLADVLAFTPFLNSAADSPNYRARFDLDASENVGMSDLLQSIPYFNLTCGYYPHVDHPAQPVLRAETTHFEVAQVWYSNVGNILVEQNAGGLPTCDEVKLASDHWTNATDLKFFLSLVGNCASTSDARVIFRWSTVLDAGEAALVVPYDASPFRQCTEDNPCHFADLAEVLLNQDMPEMTNDAAFRHTVFTHEFGHVAGQGHTQFPPVCLEAPWTIMASPGNCLLDFGVHRVRPNDSIFTNIKY